MRWVRDMSEKVASASMGGKCAVLEFAYRQGVAGIDGEALYSGTHGGIFRC